MLLYTLWDMYTLKDAYSIMSLLVASLYYRMIYNHVKKTKKGIADKTNICRITTKQCCMLAIWIT